MKSRSCGSVNLTSISSSFLRRDDRKLSERRDVIDLCGGCEKQPDLQNHHRKECFFDKLSDDIIMYNIMDYIGDLQTLLCIGALCKRFRHLVCSENLSGWDRFIVHLCVDDYCPLCMLRNKNYDAVEGALSLIRSYPVRRINVHCFVSDVTRILEALPGRKTVYQISLKLTNKIYSPSLYDSISPELDKSTFDQVKMLTLDSCNLNHVSLAGRARLLVLLGSRLEYLKFLGLTPNGIFKCVSDQCPELKKLRVDKVSNVSDFDSLVCPNLEELILCRAQFVPRHLKNFPHLQRLRYTSAVRLDQMQIENFVNSLPQTLTHIDVEVPSSFADHLLFSIAQRLHNVQSIIIESACERGTISAEAMRAVAYSCHQLKTFEIYSAQSVCDLILSREAYMVLGEMRVLRGFKIKLKEEFVNLLPSLIANSSSSLVDITFWERHRWLGKETWKKIQCLLGKVCHENTRAVQVKLVDSNLGPFFSVVKINNKLTMGNDSHDASQKEIVLPLLENVTSAYEGLEDEPLEF